MELELEKFLKFMSDIERYQIKNYNKISILARDNNKAIIYLQGIISFITEETGEIYAPAVTELVDKIQKTKGRIEHLELFVS